MRRFEKQRGMVFILAITALFVLLILAMASVQIAMQSLDRAAKQRDATLALDLAEAGADFAEVWLRSQPYPPTGSSSIDPVGGEVELSSGSFEVEVRPHPGNSGAWRKSYTLIGTGHPAHSEVTRQVIVQVREQSFALYSYFTDQERSSVTNGTIWFYARDRLYGPVHSNDQFHISWDRTSADPIFYGTVSSAASSVDWQPNQPSSTRDWRRVLQGGKDALTLGADRIELPTMSDLQRNAAWGSEVGFPTTNGVYVPTIAGECAGGIYVRGSCTITFSVDVAAGDQLIAITQGSTTTDIRVNLDGNNTTVGSTTYSGLPNGVIYCTGDVTSLSGTLADNYEDGTNIIKRNAWTIATDVAAGGDITITDNLKYQTEPMENRPPDHPSNLRAATLGLVADTIMLATGCPNEMTLDGVFLANNTFYYQGWNSVKRNNLHLLGGLIQRKRGPIGQFGSNNVHLKGYNKDYRYDSRMADYPPPYFPTTGQYDVLSWQYR